MIEQLSLLLYECHLLYIREPVILDTAIIYLRIFVGGGKKKVFIFTGFLWCSFSIPRLSSTRKHLLKTSERERIVVYCSSRSHAGNFLQIVYRIPEGQSIGLGFGHSPSYLKDPYDWLR